jgi:cytochrome P450
MDMTPSVDLTGTFSSDLHSVLRAAMQQGPLATDEATGATVVLHQRDIEALAQDQRLEGIRMALFDLMGITSGPLRDWYAQLMLTNEGDFHRRMRSLVSRAFTPRSAEALRATAADMAAESVAAVHNGGDIVAVFSTMGTRLMCRLLGVPDSDVPAFAAWLDALSPVFLVMTPEQIVAATTAIEELHSYVGELTTRRSRDPGPDLITALLSSEADGERLTRGEIIAMIANLLVAGHDTVGGQIPCSVLVALHHRADISGADGSALTHAVAETMRMEPTLPYLPRTAVAPIELHGTTIPGGSTVFLCIAAAYRDASAWREPDLFDPGRFSRPGAPRLLNFGAGTHHCLGHALARMAVGESVAAVLSATPALQLSEDPDDIPWRQVLGRSPARLLVHTSGAA